MYFIPINIFNVFHIYKYFECLNVFHTIKYFECISYLDADQGGISLLAWLLILLLGSLTVLVTCFLYFPMKTFR